MRERHYLSRLVTMRVHGSCGCVWATQTARAAEITAGSFGGGRSPRMTCPNHGLVVVRPATDRRVCAERGCTNVLGRWNVSDTCHACQVALARQRERERAATIEES